MKTEKFLDNLRNHPDLNSDEDVKDQVRAKLRYKAESLEKRHTYVHVGKIASGLLLFAVSLLIFFSPGGQEFVQRTVNGLFQGEETVIDNHTTPELPIIHGDNDDYLIIQYRYDDMDRGNHDFFDKDIVVDVMHYETNELKRGDIIAYKENAHEQEWSLIRVVGLPGEKVKIEKGQIHINNKKLDTFYGRAHRVGRDLNALKAELKQGELESANVEQNVKNIIAYFETFNEDEIVVPEGQVYVIGDDWFRTHRIGLLPVDTVVGKVLGYSK